MDSTKIQKLIEKKNYKDLRLYVDLGFELTLTALNGDCFEKFGDASNILYKALILNNIELIRKQKRKLWNVQNNQGYTPLHWAIVCHRNNVIDFILEESTNIFVETLSGENCLTLASRYNNTVAFAKILKKTNNFNKLSQANE